MTPFQQFRLWLRRAPLGERAGALCSLLVVLACVVWLVTSQATTTPLTNSALGGATSGAAVSGTTTGRSQAASESVHGGTPAAESAVSAVGVRGATARQQQGKPSTTVDGGGSLQSRGTSAPVKPSCPSAASGVQGVSRTAIRVAVVVGAVTGPASNASVGVAPPAQQKAAYRTVIDSVNAAGGIGCRRIAADFVEANPADSSDLQQKCLDIVNAGDFAVIDFGAYANFPQKHCFAQYRIPYFGGFFLNAQEQAQYLPYLFALNQYETVYRNTVFGLRDRGMFSAAKGFKKLGFLHRSCQPKLASSVEGWLREAGVTAAQTVTYDLGCPSTFASPADIQQAVLTFKNAGVTHVVPVDFVADAAAFTRSAEQQGFRPVYGFADDGILGITNSNLSPDPSNIVNALIVTPSRVGEQHVAGMRPTPATAKCDAIYRAAGQPPTWQQNVVAGTACDQVWMFQAAVEHTTVLRADALAEGLRQAKSVDFSYPYGPNDFTGEHVTTAGQYWHVEKFEKSCSCWRLIDPTFHPAHQ